MESLFVNALRIDSRFRTPSSASSTEFQIALPQTLEFSSDTVAYVSAVSFPNSWWNVDSDISDRCFVIETRTVGGAVRKRCRAVQIQAGQYTSLTLPTSLAAALNAGTSLVGMQYQVDYLSSRGTLRIQLAMAPGGALDASAKFQLPSEDELSSAQWRAANWVDAGGTTADAYDTSAPDAMTDLLRLPSTSAATTVLETGLLNVSPIDCLYLHSNLNNFDTMGPRGERTIIQRIPITVGYGLVNHYVANGSSEEAFNCGGAYRFLEFSLRTSRGRVVDLHGGQVSIELVFHKKSLYV
jgi:hypothetical protein